jgi:CMP-N,N'-diacetyllegionaminic acid synthase
MNCIAIIPARGGSKGIPNKNLISFCGKPLLAWSILQAKKSKNISNVYVSSNDKQILDTAEQYGALPIERPPELSTDTASSESALKHAIDHLLENNIKIDAVVFLQATSPLREAFDIDKAIEKFIEEKADSLFSMTVLDDFMAWKYEDGKLVGATFDPISRTRRQDSEDYYLENGSIYVFKPSIIQKHNNRLGGDISIYEMPFWKSYEIDTLEDIDLCSFYFENKILNGGPK